MNNLSFAFRSVEGRCYDNRLGAKCGKWAYPPSFVALAFRNGLEDRNADERVNSSDEPSTSVGNLVSFRSKIPEFRDQNVYRRRRSVLGFVSLPRRRHCYAGQATRQALPHISSLHYRHLCGVYEAVQSTKVSRL